MGRLGAKLADILGPGGWGGAGERNRPVVLTLRLACSTGSGRPVRSSTNESAVTRPTPEWVIKQPGSSKAWPLTRLLPSAHHDVDLMHGTVVDKANICGASQ